MRILLYKVATLGRRGDMVSGKERSKSTWRRNWGLSREKDAIKGSEDGIETPNRKLAFHHVGVVFKIKTGSDLDGHNSNQQTWE